MDALELLLNRTSALKLTEPGPNASELDQIFRSALRAPDHGRLRPWRFVVIPSDKRERYGELMSELLHLRTPDATPEMLAGERDKALRAPLIIIAAARVKDHPKIPEVEQVLSAGAAVQNIMLTAEAIGYGAMWRTGAPAYDARVKKMLGLDDTDVIAGIVYLGTRAGGSSPAVRPLPADFVRTWAG